MTVQFVVGYKSIDDLRPPNDRKFDTPIQKERRGAVPIAVIDDQTFQPRGSLRNYGYDINEIGDISDITNVRNFPIVLCDLMDVGGSFDGALQGASIIREIRRNYPAIVVAAYTGSSASSETSRVRTH